MNELLPALASPTCHPGHACTRPPCFQARLEATKDNRHIHHREETCAEHLGRTVQALTTWAHNRGYRGKLTILAIDQPTPGTNRPLQSRVGLVFSTISLTQQWDHCKRICP